MKWYSVGLIDDFATNLADQMISAEYARVFPYYSLRLTSSDCTAVKRLDSTSTDINISACIYGEGYYNAPGLITVSDASKNTLFKVDMSLTNHVQYLSAWVSGVGAVGNSFAISTNTIVQVELHVVSNGSNSALQLFVNGTQVIAYSGTGPSNAISYIIFRGGIYLSDVIITDEGYIGAKRPILLNAIAAGDNDPPTCYDTLGNNPAVKNADTTVGKLVTTICALNFQYSGTVTQIKVRLANTGTYRVGILTKNANGTYTSKYYSDILTAIDTNQQTLTAGINFPNTWTVTKNDTVAVYSITADFPISGSSAIDNINEFTPGAKYSGDGLTLSLIHI